MRTVLGLSKTSTSIGWVLVDGRDVTGTPLDHDSFDITDSSAAAPVATARRVCDIATASGYTVDSIHVTTSGNISALRDALTESGFDNVLPVSLTAATRAWAMGTARDTLQQKSAVCILGCDSASLSMVDTCSGATQATTTTNTNDIACFSDWLNFALGERSSRPEVLYLIGSRSKLDAVAGPLAERLAIPVVATHDAQLALAHGAASSTVRHVEPVLVKHQAGVASHVRALSAVGAVAVVSLFSLSSAGSPITLAEHSSAGSAAPPAAPQAAQPPEFPIAAAPVAPLVSPPPQPAAQPEPVDPLPVAVPEPAVAAPDAVTPEAVPVAVPETVVPTPPVEHLPEAQPVEHIPDSDAAPGPAAPAPLPPPPPPDPLAGVLSPLFGGYS